MLQCLLYARDHVIIDRAGMRLCVDTKLLQDFQNVFCRFIQLFRDLMHSNFQIFSFILLLRSVDYFRIHKLLDFIIQFARRFLIQRGNFRGRTHFAELLP